MSSRPVRKWVTKQIDKATEHEKSKLQKVRGILKELEVITGGSNEDLELAIIDANSRVKLAMSIVGE